VLGGEVIFNKKVTNHHQAHYVMERKSSPSLSSQPSSHEFGKFICELASTSKKEETASNSHDGAGAGISQLKNVSLYIPAYIGKGNNDYLKSMKGVVDDESNNVILDKHLMRCVCLKRATLLRCARVF
jgi:hypothetical protein